MKYFQDLQEMPKLKRQRVPIEEKCPLCGEELDLETSYYWEYHNGGVVCESQYRVLCSDAGCPVKSKYYQTADEAFRQWSTLL